MKRSKHSLSHYKLVTCDFGRLIPVGLVEALPGDTFQHSTSLLLRLSPLMAPVMHPVSVRIHHWFVPNRIVWPEWEKFITGGKDGLGEGAVYPTNANTQVTAKGDIYDYFGVPPASYAAGMLNQLPARGYNMIYNEFYRDEDLVNEVLPESQAVQKVAWEKDYFTSARPWSQKGPSVSLPMGATAPVVGVGAPTLGGISVPVGFRGQIGDPTAGAWSDQAPSNSNMAWVNPALQADLSSAEAADIIEIRRAFALQRYQEARAQYGSRYTEYLRYLGIRSSDARLQRPEYLGGGKQTIAFSEVLRTGNETTASTNPIGEMKGHGISAMRSNRYRYFCEEHGYIFSLLSIRPRSMYINGLPRTFSRRTKEDYYQKELELIGQQEVYEREVFANNPPVGDQVFGYQDRYSEYRHEYSNISGDFRDTLDFWHLGRDFAAPPTLNASFVECDPSKRIFAEQTEHSCWIMVSHSIQARRMVGKNTIGRVI